VLQGTFKIVSVVILDQHTAATTVNDPHLGLRPALHQALRDEHGHRADEPEQAGLPAYGGNRRVPGLRREEAAMLSGYRLGRALCAPVLDDPVRPPNTARFTFLNPRGPEFYRDWEATAKDMVAVLRAEAGRNPYDRGLTDLVGELSTRSETFRTLWATHDVMFHRTGGKRLHHPSSATSTSPTRHSTCPPTQDSGCSCTPRSPPAPPPTH
jgi:hypothetical protein